MRNNALSPTSGTKPGCPLSSFLFYIILYVLLNAITQENNIKGVEISKEEIKLCLFADKMIIYVESPKELIKTKSNSWN